MLSAIIVAAGSSQRMGFDKTFALLAGKPVVSYSLAAFEAVKGVTQIILVGRNDRLRDLGQIVAAGGHEKVRDTIPGGDHRQDSVRGGLALLDANCRYIAVHDAARPLITVEQIERVFEQCQIHGAAALAEPVTETLKRAGRDQFVIGSVDRDGLYAMQTPQIFKRELLVKAYDFVVANNITITDEVSAVQHLGAKVRLVPNIEFNLKITYPRDLHVAESLLTRRPVPVRF